MTAAFLEKLQDAALQTHNDLLRHSVEDPDRMGMATTLTLWLGPVAARLSAAGG